MDAFKKIEARAAKLKGGASQLEALLPKPASAAALTKRSDDAYLAEMAKCIFRAGFVWKIVEHKWPGFEAAFWQFNVRRNAATSDEDLEKLVQDERIIRNGTKILAVRENARFILEVAAEHGSFGKFLADWPGDDIIGLLKVMKKQGSRLGGNTGLYFLRFVGKDTFMFSQDVVKTLIEQGVITTNPTSQKDLKAAQAAFNIWREESGRPLCQISRILAASQG